MQNKEYKTVEHAPSTVGEPAVAYEIASAATSPSDRWNPNVPFHGTQEEWREHFHRIEEGTFYPVSEVHQRILQWIDSREK